MTRDDIIRMSREAGWSQKDIDSLLYIVETAAAAEREACARVVENYALGYAEPVWALKLTAVIRARGQA